MIVKGLITIIIPIREILFGIRVFSATRLGRLGDPGVSPPPRQGSFVVFYLKTGLGTRPNLFGLAPLNPEVGFHMVVTGNAITNACDWSGI